MRIALSSAVVMGAAFALFASPAEAVVGEVTVTDAGNEFPDATVSLQFDDGDKVVAQEDEKRPGTYIFILPEERAEQTATLTIMKDDKTFSDRVRIADGAPKTFPGGPGYTLTRNVGGPPVQQAKGAPGAERAGGPAMGKGGPQFSAYAKPYYDWQSRPSTTIGFKEFGVTRYPIKLDNFSSDPGVEAGFRVDFPWPLQLGNVRLGKSWGIDLNVNYFGTNSKHDIGQLPAAGANFGLYGPFAGGGVATAQDLNNVVLNNDFSRTTGEIRLRKNYDLWGADMRTYVGFCFGGVEVDDDLDLMVGNNIDYRSRIKMDNFYYGPTGGFLVNLPMPALDLGNSKYVFYFGGYGQVMFNDAEIKRQVDLTGAVNLSGADKFTHSETTLGGGIKIGGRYELGRLSVHWGGEFAINENVPEQHVDPNTGDATARFGTARDYKISVGALYRF